MNSLYLLISACVGIIIADKIIVRSKCRLAKKTNKKICNCWDCKQKCELYKRI